MKKRTLKKNKSLKRKYIKNRNSLKKDRKTKRKIAKKDNTKKKSIKKNKKILKQTGGGSDLETTLDVLLSNDKILFLPTSQVFDYKKLDRYVRMVDVSTLKDIVLENINLKKSPTIQKIFNYSSDELKDPKKISLKPEDVNCQNLIEDRNFNVKKLFLYLFDCNENIYVKKDVDWFRVCIGLDELDDTFEYKCMKKLIEMKVIIDPSEIKEKIKLLEDNLDFKLIIKRRLYNCSEKPRTFLENIFGGISFPSFEKCDKKSPGGILYLYDEYKRFLMKDHENLSKLDKVKILIFCETRQHLLSKYIALELVRLDDKNYSQIRDILNKLFKLDKEIIEENDKKLIKIKEQKEKEKRKQLDLENNFKEIDDKYEDKSKELTEEEKMIAEMEERKKKSDNEKNNFTNSDNKISEKINNQEGGGDGEINPNEQGNGLEPTPEPTSNPFNNEAAIVEANPIKELSDTTDNLDSSESTDNPSNNESAILEAKPLGGLPNIIDTTSTIDSTSGNLSTTDTETKTDSMINITPLPPAEIIDNTLNKQESLDNQPFGEQKEVVAEIPEDNKEHDKQEDKKHEVRNAVQNQQDVKGCDLLSQSIRANNELITGNLKLLEGCDRVSMDPFKD